MIDELPPMTDPLGRYWKQPRPHEIVLDNTHALVSADAFRRLSEYSSTVPTGVYVGKAWRSYYAGAWFLRWYDAHPTDADLCSIETRELLVVEV